jgi:hypothetical protein
LFNARSWRLWAAIVADDDPLQPDGTEAPVIIALLIKHQHLNLAAATSLLLYPRFSFVRVTTSNVEITPILSNSEEPNPLASILRYATPNYAVIG